MHTPIKVYKKKKKNLQYKQLQIVLSMVRNKVHTS